MFEGNEESHPEAEQPDQGHPAAGEDVGAPEEGAGRRKEKATPEIGDEGVNKGETSHPAPDDDVGVPPDAGEPKE